MSAPALRMSRLYARAGEHTLLSDVEVSLPPGRILAVLGESGAGKSTLGLAALGECAVGVRLGGSVEVGGVELLGAGQRDRRRGRVGHLPQHPGAVLDPVRRVGAVLDELAATVHGCGRAARAAREAAVHEALDAARLPADRELRRRFPHRLSGGQQQRMALAQTLVTAPDVVVLDEPTTGLDPVTTEEVVANLAALAERGTALVLLTHDIAVARALAHDALVLRAGTVVGRGVPDLPHDSDASPAGTAPAAALRLVVGDLAVVTGRGVPLLHGLDVTVGRGECLAVVGRSGAGKTSFARALAGLITPRRGTVTVDGHGLPAALRDRDRAERRLVQYVHQDARSSFLDHQPVLDQVARPGILLRGLEPDQARAEADELLDRLGVDLATRRRRPAGLSGGQLQRAAVARALTARPAVLVCDEVTSALGRRHQLDLLAAIDRLRHDGDTTVVLVSHDLELVGAVADHVAVLDQGHLCEHTTVSDLWNHPASTAGARLVGAVRTRQHRADTDAAGTVSR